MTEMDTITLMRPEEFRERIKTIGWRVSDLAWVLDIDTRVTARWASGVREVPLHVGAWLRTLAAFHAKHPLPQDWRVDAASEEIG